MNSVEESALSSKEQERYKRIERRIQELTDGKTYASVPSVKARMLEKLQLELELEKVKLLRCIAEDLNRRKRKEAAGISSVYQLS